MAAFFIHVTGQKYYPITRPGAKEHDFILNQDEVVGHGSHSIERKVLCREGNEPLVLAPKGAKCQGGIHAIKADVEVYELSPGRYTCKTHIHTVPTLDQLRAQYDRPHFLNMSFES